jgi:replicative DNA helicase
MKSYEERIQLEKEIISELIFDPNGYVKVASYLSVKNFSLPAYVSIYEACIQMYPNKIIDPTSVSERTGIPTVDLFRYYYHENVTINLSAVALKLVEVSIQDQLIEKVKELIAKRDNPNTDLQEIFEEVSDPETDIFTAINEIISYTETRVELNYECLSFIEFKQNVIDKCTQIRSELHIKSLYFNLENVYQFDYRKKEILQALSNLTRHVMANDVPAALATKILNLATSI